jgi:hypothetical protein
MTTTFDFVRALLGDCAGYLTLTALHPTASARSPSRHLCVNDTAALVRALRDLQAANTAGWGAYLSLATRKYDLGRWHRGTRNDLSALPALWVDLDYAPQEAQPRLDAHDPPPSCVVQSGGGVHAYWYLDVPTDDWTWAQAALDGLRAALGGDRTHVSGMLRLPNTINTKPNRGGALCRIVTHNSTRHAAEKFIAAYPRKTVQTLQTVQSYAQSKESNTLKTDHKPIKNPSVTDQNLPKPFRNRGLIDAVVSALQLQHGGRWQPNGWLAATCPCGHRHDRPGQHFAFNPTTGYGVCLGRHGTLNMRHLCAVLNLSFT